jgi:predicted transcriptional regulator
MTTKEKILYTIEKLPDDTTIEEAIDELILLDKIEQGLKDADEGKVYSTEELRDRLKEWLK